MLILALESSASPASVAVAEDGKFLGEFFVNVKQTHSQTLLLMAQELLNVLGKTCGDVDRFAVVVGPGSFTGVRIGVASVKGMAFPKDTPCCGVSTLEAIAQGGRALAGKTLCAVMDARCGQVYNALFQTDGEKLTRLCEDRALSIDELSAECESMGDRVILLGDGAALCYRTFQSWGAVLAPVEMRFQRAFSVAQLAWEKGETVCVPPWNLAPRYLRLPQAERELKQKNERKGS